MFSTIVIATLFYVITPCIFMILPQTISETMFDEERNRDVTIEIHPIQNQSITKDNGNDIISDNIRVTITSSNDVISIQLTRLKLKSQKVPPLMTITPGGLQTDTVEERKIQKTFYRNEDTKTAFTFTHDRGGLIEVFGHFIKDGQLHSILPFHNKGYEKDLKYIRSRPRKRYIPYENHHRQNATVPIKKHKMSSEELPFDYETDELEFTDTMPRNLKTTKRIKREDTPRKMFVEYLIVTDYENYKLWHKETENMDLTDQQKDGLTKYRMMEFYQHVIHGVDTIVSSLNNQSLQLDVVLAGVVFTNVSGFATWTENKRTCSVCSTVDDQEVLRDFAQWRKDILSKVVRHDHAALYTGFDLYYAGQKSSKTVGLSYLGNMCTNGSVSIVEEKKNALTIHIAAHELGHNFGAHHDGGKTTQTCSNNDRYLMASSMTGTENSSGGSNPWTFSPCSKGDVFNYIMGLAIEDNCLLNVPLKPSLAPLVQPGITYSADQQCQGQFGNASSVCREYHLSDWSGLCYSLACRNVETVDCILIFPHEGTPCGHKKWCQRGKCIEHEDALAVNDFCPLGDDPHLDCAYICEHFDQLMDYYNYDEVQRGFCCNTCFNSSLRTTQETSTSDISTTSQIYSSITISPDASTSVIMTDIVTTPDTKSTNVAKTEATESTTSFNSFTKEETNAIYTSSTTPSSFTTTSTKSENHDATITHSSASSIIPISKTTMVSRTGSTDSDNLVTSQPVEVTSSDKSSDAGTTTLHETSQIVNQTISPHLVQATGGSTLSTITASGGQSTDQKQSSTVTKETFFSQYTHTKNNIYTSEYSTQSTGTVHTNNQNTDTSSSDPSLMTSSSHTEVNIVLNKAHASNLFSLHSLLFYLLTIFTLS